MVKNNERGVWRCRFATILEADVHFEMSTEKKMYLSTALDAKVKDRQLKTR